MSNTNYTKALPWDDRWNEPTLDQLIEPIEENFRGMYVRLLEGLKEIEGVEWAIKWHGPGWRWSVQVTLGSPKSEDSPVMCYLVPYPERPVYTIPLSDDTIASLPKKRLSKYIRDGIRSAKWSVDIFWATWSPATDNEINFLLDLLKRKHAHLTSEEE